MNNSQEYPWKEDHRRSFRRRGYSFRNSLDQLSPLQVNAPHLPVLHNPYIIILTQGPEIRSVLPNFHVISMSHSGLAAQCRLILPTLFSLHVNDVHSHSHTLVYLLYGRHGHCGQVPRATFVRWLRCVIREPSSTVSEGMNNRN